MSTSPHVQARLAALREAHARQPRDFARVLGRTPCPNASTCFGALRFDPLAPNGPLHEDARRRLAEVVAGRAELAPDLAEEVAAAVGGWALRRGATHFTHWFQPLVGGTAEKHESFLTTDPRPLEALSGRALLQSEPDASFFPTGGLRGAGRARGYAVWDPGASFYLVPGEGPTLYIPAVFVSRTGEALDHRAPLLRSLAAVDRAARRLLAALGRPAGRVEVTLGCEQEYFLVDRGLYSLRPDLQLAGRCLFSAPSPRDQQFADHYFGAIPPRVRAFMDELDFELHAFGVPAATRHHEVAPAQFEVAATCAEARVAVDENLLLVDRLRRVARRHGFEALLHDKPYAGINGSGKHHDWSLRTETGENLLASDEPAEDLRFQAVLAAVLLGAHRHAALLRLSVASYANDFRLGGSGAPPAIVSAYLGTPLHELVEALAEGREPTPAPEGGQLPVAPGLPPIRRDAAERNRSSPFAFTGDGFEFRSPGAGQNPAWPTTLLDVAVADGMEQLADWIEELGGGEDAVRAAVRRALAEAQPFLYEGDSYAEDWRAEARRRGLPEFATTPEALSALLEGPSARAIERLGVLSAAEREARARLIAEQYRLQAELEARLAVELVDTLVLPAALEERRLAAQADLGAELGGADGVARRRFRALSESILALEKARLELAGLLEQLPGLPLEELPGCLRPALERLAVAANRLEGLVADERWPLPKLRELLFAGF